MSLKTPTKTCFLCPRPYYALELCTKHYSRLNWLQRKHRNPDLPEIHRQRRRARALDPVKRDHDLAYHRRNSKRRRDLGVSPEEYDRMVAAAGGVCEICKKACITGRALALDHDHTTLKVRGLLCTNCNHGIGKFKDDVHLMQAAIDYLRARG